MERPNLELKGFTRIAVKAGETETATIPLPTKRVAYWNVQKHSFEVEPDQVQIMIGASSADIRLKQTIQVNN